MAINKKTRERTMRTAQAKINIDFSVKNPKNIGLQIRQQEFSVAEISNHLKQAETDSAETVYLYTKGLIATQITSEQFIAEGKEVFNTSLQLSSSSRKSILSAITEETGRAGSLFLIQNISALKTVDARTYMKDLLDSGGQVADVTEWLQIAGSVLKRHNIKASDTAGSVIDAIGDAAEWVVDTIEDGVDAILEGIDAIIDAVTDAGVAIIDLLEDIVDWTADRISELLAALIEAGIELIEFVGATFAWAYDAVSNFVQAAFAIGLTIADLLETIVTESYWVLRRFVNGIIENLGPIGDILDFVLTQVENASSTLWRSTLLAIRFAQASLLEVLNWMADQTATVFKAIVIAWESIGENLLTLYEWALQAGSLVWQVIGEVTQTIGNSIYYVYNFLSTSGVEFIFDFTRGLIQAGAAIGGLIGWAVEKSIEICGEVIRAGLDVGLTIANMLVEIARDPGSALEIFIQGMQNIGQTLDDLLQATIIDTAEEFIDEVVKAVLEIGTAVLEICEAALRLSGAALAIMVAHLLNTLGTYRSMRAEEIADARLVFGNSLDYDLIFLSNEDPLNEILFGIQDLFTGNPNSRAFVTTNLINFDVDDGDIDRPTLIHELTHVWQSREVGGIYMAEAIIAQIQDGSAAYDYGYDSPVPETDELTIQDKYDGNTTEYDALGHIMGAGGDAALNAAAGDFEVFNREMQGQIMMHWFVRTQLEIRDAAATLIVPDATAWDPYQQLVFNS